MKPHIDRGRPVRINGTRDLAHDPYHAQCIGEIGIVLGVQKNGLVRGWSYVKSLSGFSYRMIEWTLPKSNLTFLQTYEEWVASYPSLQRDPQVFSGSAP